VRVKKRACAFLVFCRPAPSIIWPPQMARDSAYFLGSSCCFTAPIKWQRNPRRFPGHPNGPASLGDGWSKDPMIRLGPCNFARNAEAPAPRNRFAFQSKPFEPCCVHEAMSIVKAVLVAVRSTSSIVRARFAGPKLTDFLRWAVLAESEQNVQRSSAAPVPTWDVGGRRAKKWLASADSFAIASLAPP